MKPAREPSAHFHDEVLNAGPTTAETTAAALRYIKRAGLDADHEALVREALGLGGRS